MTEILSRGYAHNSDPDGGLVRCGENGTTCTVPLGPDGISEINAGQRSPENFNDVDDYIGCWYTNTYSQSNCTETAVGSLTDVLGANISNEYSNFAANVTVVEETIDGTSEFKKISVSIVAGKYGSYTFHAHRGNY
jgi:MSHA pilin protein MshD